MFYRILSAGIRLFWDNGDNIFKNKMYLKNMCQNWRKS